MEDLTAITCQSVGVAGTTRIHFIKTGSQVVARVGIAIFGMTNQRNSPYTNPFDPSFHDNYAEGIGPDRDGALRALKEDLKKISDSLWAE